jgi:hypothetical protein
MIAICACAASRPAVIPEWAAAAEETGFSALGTIGRVAYPGVMDTVALAAAAGATSTIGLLSNVMVAQGVRDSPRAVKEAVTAFGDLGADKLIFNASTGDIKEVSRLAETIL